MVEAVIRVGKAIYPICSFHDLDFQDLVDEHELKNGDLLLNSIGLMHIDLQHNVQSGCEDVSSYYYLLSPEIVPLR